MYDLNALALADAAAEVEEAFGGEAHAAEVEVAEFVACGEEGFEGLDECLDAHFWH